MKVRYRPLELQTKHEFRISRGGRALFQNLVVEIEHQGRIGRGEVAAASYHGETQETAMRALSVWAPLVGDDPWAREAIVARCQEALPGNRAALSGIECALWDLCGQEAGQPVWRLLGVDPARMPISSLTLGLADWPTMEKKLDEAREFPVLKIKVGGEDDLETVRKIRARTRQRLTVDANAAWTVEQALELIPRLADLGVEFVEQPLAIEDLEGFTRLHELSLLPIYADESIGTAADVIRFQHAIDGVNLKLAKSGGIAEGWRVIATARACGLAVMIGCMIESSLGITSAAHLAPLVDHLDLDGHWLLADDPFTWIDGGAGRIVLPTAPGLGVEPRLAASDARGGTRAGDSG
ncbi:MAG TPA: dipeptide epimerase [Candidatus Eisenbacteria bacterium]|jgi:L-alanine-DL-glutamate epimerase-like enolase superfamily enzyme|nr:dipeptide epimerase [Candidatus Eisenbacteria bacterium]